MAQLGIRLRVFIASPGDVLKERDLVEHVLLDLARLEASQAVFLEPFRWESDVPPGLGRPQDIINDYLRESELLIAIFWSRIGSISEAGGKMTGSQEELSFIRKLVERGETDDAFVYFCHANPPPNTEPDQLRALLAFRKHLETTGSALCKTYKDERHFAELVKGDIERWVQKWREISRICRETLLEVTPSGNARALHGENRLSRARLYFDDRSNQGYGAELGRCAVTVYQRFGSDGLGKPFDVNHETIDWLDSQDLIRPVEDTRDFVSQLTEMMSPFAIGPPVLRRTEHGNYLFGSAQWFYYFCAIGLVHSINEDRKDAVERIEYLNDVHQHLSAMINDNPILDHSEAANKLVNWLRATRSSPIVRNFAAYVLGMICSRESEDALAEAARDDTGEDVRLYSVASLGRLRSRRYLRLLVSLYSSEPDPRVRSMIGQAVCRTVGIAEYPL